MSYQVLARKWRPKSFETLIGQDNTVQALSNALDQNRLHHAYLFTGTRGVGKTTLARLLAKSLNCEKEITSKPCNKCSSCTAIDIGRFPDLIEVDAASNTKVDEMRELLDNAQYAPTSGRFKVYIIDEVHMLSNSAFNSMLKTLEEPPDHVKFILATTDPRKVPVTVISRCLQFNLKQMTNKDICNYLEIILKSEKIEFDLKSLVIIAKSACGSMRDALSILDQAIAYCGDDISHTKVIEMLGSVDETFLIKIISFLANKDSEKLIDIIHKMSQKNISFDIALGDLAQLIHQIITYKMVPASFKNKDNEENIKQLARLFNHEALQLLYQITINGRKDLYLAPNEHIGFSMTILRMLAFYPSFEEGITSNLSKKDIVNEEKKDIVNEEKKDIVNEEKKDIVNEEKKDFNGNWRDLVENLKLGIAKTLAQECELIDVTNSVFNLYLDEKNKHLIQNHYVNKLEESLINYFNKKIKLNIKIGNVLASPTIEKKTEKSAILQTAESAIMKDNFVKKLIDDFGAEIVPTSIRAIKKKGERNE